MFQFLKKKILLICILGVTSNLAIGQTQDKSNLGFFAPADTFNQKRFNYALGISATTYTGFSIGLYHAWYKQYPQEGFHFFNDAGEWSNMDKIGHVYTAYFQGVLCYKGAKWTGLSENKSILVGAICGSLFQSTIEMMDGFSTQWGFSLYDMGANVAGIGLYTMQQKYWKDQRITLKVSSIPSNYPNHLVVGTQGTTVSLQERADDLFGSSYAEKFLKDYNAQAYWASVNVHSFLPEGNNWPSWLNIALGYGADNMYGGFENKWERDGEHFAVDTNAFPRTHQVYLGFDIDLTRIKTNNDFLKGILSMFNIFKMPSPALELNSQGEFTFHILR